jgi:Zn-dependent protease
VPIRLHWSFPLLVLLVIAPAGARLDAATLLGALGWLVALFASVVVHELSHSLVARRRGFVVRDIVLLPIGGSSQISGLPGSPSDELAIAVAGPLASLFVGLGLLLVALATGGHPWPPTLLAGAITARLGWANLLLAGFNLLPAIPMDGGRVLRALLARRRSDLQATVLAVRVSRLVGLAMVLAGLRYDPWLCLIGVFVGVGAGGEQRAAAVRTATGGLKVYDVMVHDPTTLEASFPLSAVAPFLQASPGRILPVTDNGRYLGLIAADHLPGPPGALLVGDATDRLAPVLSPGDPVYPLALERLLGGRRRAATVIEDGRVVGVLYSPHLLAAVRRATAAAGASTTLP